MKKILYMFAITALVLGMASCGDEPAAKVHKTKIQGCLDGLFSVSPTEQVYFSQGNLEYFRLTSQYRWEFAPNQYRTLGASNAQIADMPMMTAIDLFGWNTANDPTKHSKNDADYKSKFVDWGINPIWNGGDEPNLWRTLSMEEWDYLFHGRKNAELLFGFGHIIEYNGTDIVNGIFILPDNWEEVKPEGITEFVPSTKKGLKWTVNEYGGMYKNTNKDNYTHNEYKVADKSWETMEKAGVVFIPCSYYRSGTDLLEDTEWGQYWSFGEFRSYGSEIYMKHLQFGPKYLDTQTGSNELYWGFSVRLVR